MRYFLVFSLKNKEVSAQKNLFHVSFIISDFSSSLRVIMPSLALEEKFLVHISSSHTTNCISASETIVVCNMLFNYLEFKRRGISEAVFFTSIIEAQLKNYALTILAQGKH